MTPIIPAHQRLRHIHHIIRIGRQTDASFPLSPTRPLFGPNAHKMSQYDETIVNPCYIPAAVLEHRVHRGVPQYLVQWMGFPPEDASWQLAADLDGTGLVEEYQVQPQEPSEDQDDDQDQDQDQDADMDLGEDFGAGPQELFGESPISTGESPLAADESPELEDARPATPPLELMPLRARIRSPDPGDTQLNISMLVTPPQPFFWMLDRFTHYGRFTTPRHLPLDISRYWVLPTVVRNDRGRRARTELVVFSFPPRLGPPLLTSPTTERALQVVRLTACLVWDVREYRSTYADDALVLRIASPGPAHRL